jgi:hypothetical protein
MALQGSDRPLPAVVLDHPTQTLTLEQLAPRSRQLADAAERLLNGEEPEGPGRP